MFIQLQMAWSTDNISLNNLDGELKWKYSQTANAIHIFQSLKRWTISNIYFCTFWNLLGFRIDVMIKLSICFLYFNLCYISLFYWENLFLFVVYLVINVLEQIKPKNWVLR